MAVVQADYSVRGGVSRPLTSRQRSEQPSLDLRGTEVLLRAFGCRVAMEDRLRELQPTTGVQKDGDLLGETTSNKNASVDATGHNSDTEASGRRSKSARPRRNSTGTTPNSGNFNGYSSLSIMAHSTSRSTSMMMKAPSEFLSTMAAQRKQSMRSAAEVKQLYRALQQAHDKEHRARKENKQLKEQLEHQQKELQSCQKKLTLQGNALASKEQEAHDASEYGRKLESRFQYGHRDLLRRVTELEEELKQEKEEKSEFQAALTAEKAIASKQVRARQRLHDQNCRIWQRTLHSSKPQVPSRRWISAAAHVLCYCYDFHC
mgnify:CR=1 FL=1